MMRGFRKRRRSTRFGTTAVETALVLPVFLLFVLGMVELSRAVFVQHVLNSACRKAARLGSTEGNNTATVKAKTLEILGSAVKTTAVTGIRERRQQLRLGEPGHERGRAGSDVGYRAFDAPSRGRCSWFARK